VVIETTGKTYGFSKGRIPGLLPQEDEIIREDLLKKVKESKEGI